MKYRGFLQSSVFVIVLMGLLYLREYWHSLDQTLRVTLLIISVVISVVALARAYSSKTGPRMPTLYGTLPRRWQRWIMGE
jgi:hypothetical protein